MLLFLYLFIYLFIYLSQNRDGVGGDDNVNSAGRGLTLGRPFPLGADPYFAAGLVRAGNFAISSTRGCSE